MRTAKVVAKQLPGKRDSGGRQRIGAFLDYYSMRFDRIDVYGFGDCEFESDNVHIHSFTLPHLNPSRLLTESAFVSKWKSVEMSRAIALDLGPTDYLHVDFPQMMVNVPRARRVNVLDFHNLEFQRVKSLISDWPAPFRYLAELEAVRLRRFEVRSAHRAEWVTTCSAEDSRVLQQAGARTLLIPNGVTNPPASWVPPPRSKTALYVGSMDYAPNVQGLKWLLRTVWPVVRASEPRARLIVAGRQAYRVASLLANVPNAYVCDSPESLTSLYQDADLCVVPLQGGGGTKIKLLEGISYGLPIVTTSFGLQGMPEVEEFVFRADTGPEFAHAILGVFSAPPDAARSRALFDRASTSIGWNSRLSPLDDLVKRFG